MIANFGRLKQGNDDWWVAHHQNVMVILDLCITQAECMTSKLAQHVKWQLQGGLVACLNVIHAQSMHWYGES